MNENKIDTSRAVDLSQLAKRQLPTREELEMLEKKYVAEMTHVSDWTEKNRELLKTLAVSDRTRIMYSNITTDNMMDIIIQRIGINPHRIPAPVVKDIHILIRRAINYGIYKGVHIAAGAKFTEPVMQDAAKIQLMSEDQAKELLNEESEAIHQSESKQDKPAATNNDTKDVQGNS